MDALARVGVSRKTYDGWMARGEDSDDEPFRTLYLAVTAARMWQARQQLAKGDEFAESGNASGVAWQKWKISKYHKREFGDGHSVEVTGKDGGPLQFEDLTPDTRKRVIEVLQVLEAGGEEIESED